MTDVRYLASEDVADLATPAEYVEVVRSAYRERGDGAPAKPRTTLRSTDPGGMLTGYLAILPDAGYMGGYTYAAGFGDGDTWFITPLFDSASGELLALLDGAAMNPFKTGATGAVAVDALARPDARTLGVIGAGSQGWGQVLATATVRDFEEVLVTSRSSASRERFVEMLAEAVSVPAYAVAATDELVGQSDVLITATTSSEPVFDDADLEPGTHVTAMGQYHPERREVDAATIARATYVPDLRERVFQDAGAYLQARDAGVITDDHIHAELGDVVAGTAPGRTSDDEITLFDSGGTAIETVAAAGMLYERARDRGLGITLGLQPGSEAFPGP